MVEFVDIVDYTSEGLYKLIRENGSKICISLRSSGSEGMNIRRLVDLFLEAQFRKIHNI